MSLRKKKFVPQEGRELVKDVIDYNKFDNRTTILYKLCLFLMEKDEDNLVPIEFISLDGDSINNYTYTTAQVVVIYKFNPSLKSTTLIEQYKSIMAEFPGLNYIDVSMLYKNVMDLYRQRKIKYFDDENNDLTLPKNIFKNINDMFIDVSETENVELFSFTDEKALSDAYDDWKISKDNKAEEQIKSSEKLLDIQTSLGDIEPIEYSEPIIEFMEFKFTPQIKSVDDKTLYSPNIEEGIEIFKNAKVSSDIPFIQYNNNEGQNYYWVYDNNFDDSKIKDVTIYSNSLKQQTRPNTIYIFLWIEKLIKCVYLIDKNQLNVEIPNKNNSYQKSIEMIENALPLIQLDEGVQIKVKGYFEIDQIIINDVSYFYMLLMDPLHKTYLYIDNAGKAGKAGKAWADKPQMSIHYKNLMKTFDETGNASSIIISLGTFITESDEEEIIPTTINPNVSELVTTPGKLRINVKKAESEIAIKNFQDIYCRLLQRYVEEREVIEERILQILPITVKDDTKSVTKNQTVISNLHRRAPDLFTGAGRICQAGRQPIIISPDEVDAWRHYEAKPGEQRQVMPYPPLPPFEDNNFENPLEIDPFDNRVKYWFVCPDSIYCYPYLKKPNEEEKTKKGKGKIQTSEEELLYLPCCGKSNSLLNPESKYYSFHDKDKLPTGKTNREGYHMVSSKILRATGKSSTARTGTIGKIFLQFLNLYKGNKNREHFSRYGVPVGPNSLIHCILVAIRDKNYLGLKSDIDKETYTNSVRNYMADNMHMNVFKQELYEINDEEIIQKLKNPEIDFDSEKFYHGLEELFKINIFVFNPGSTSEHRAETEEKLFMEIPRNKLMHIRPLKLNRPSVVIYRHWGSDKDKLNYPHCELIVMNKEESKMENESKHEAQLVYIFNSTMTNFLYKALIQSTQSYVWTQENNDITTRIDPYSKINWEIVFEKYPITGQRIDSYGKMRTLELQISKGKFMYVCIPPSQPLNLPTIENIIPIEEQTVIDIFGIPSGIAEHGLWYPAIDYQFCIYIPTIPGAKINLNPEEEEVPKSKALTKITPKKEEITSPVKGESNTIDKYRLKLKFNTKRKITPNLPIEPVIQSSDVLKVPMETMRLAKRNIYYLVQLIRWLWRIEQANFNEWWSKWVLIDDSVSEKPDDNYTLITTLPIVKTTKEGIIQLNKLWPTFFRKSIHLYKNLHDKLYELFRREVDSTQGFLHRRLSNSNNQIKYIRGLYLWEEDFYKPTLYSDESVEGLIFLSTKNLEIWLESQRRKNITMGNQLVIKENADSTQIFNNHPYLYEDVNTKRIFIIQNVQGGELNRVFNICLNWANSYTNLGFFAEPYEGDEDLSYVIYSISSAQTFIQIEDHSKDDNYFHIIRYTNEGRYSAMLPIN